MAGQCQRGRNYGGDVVRRIKLLKRTFNCFRGCTNSRGYTRTWDKVKCVVGVFERCKIMIET